MHILVSLSSLFCVTCRELNFFCDRQEVQYLELLLLVLCHSNTRIAQLIQRGSHGQELSSWLLLHHRHCDVTV